MVALKQHLMHRKWLFFAKSVEGIILASQKELREGGPGFPVLCCFSLRCLLLCFGHSFCLSQSWEITHAWQPITTGRSSPSHPMPSFPGNLSNRRAMRPPDGLSSQRETYSCHSAALTVCVFYVVCLVRIFLETQEVHFLDMHLVVAFQWKAMMSFLLPWMGLGEMRWWVLIVMALVSLCRKWECTQKESTESRSILNLNRAYI